MIPLGIKTYILIKTNKQKLPECRIPCFIKHLSPHISVFFYIFCKKHM